MYVQYLHVYNHIIFSEEICFQEHAHGIFLKMYKRQTKTPLQNTFLLSSTPWTCINTDHVISNFRHKMGALTGTKLLNINHIYSNKCPFFNKRPFPLFYAERGLKLAFEF